MFGEQIPTIWTPDEYYGRTTNFQFSINNCFKNFKTCGIRGQSVNNQKCKTCLNEFYFVENTKIALNNLLKVITLMRKKKSHSKCYDKFKTYTKLNTNNIHNYLRYYANHLLYSSTNCLNCKYNDKFVNYEQTECIDTIPSRFYINNTEI